MPTKDELERRMNKAYNAAQRHSNDPDLTKYNELMGDYEEYRREYIEAARSGDD